MKRIYYLLLAFVMLSSSAIAQTEKYWSSHTDVSKITTDKAVARLSFPSIFKLFNLNIEPLRQELFSIVDNHASRHSTIISLPNADGGIEEFQVFEASNFEPALQAQFPEIRAFSGKGITDKYATLKLSISPQGIQTMVFRTDKENEFIEAYSQNHTVYAVFKSQRRPGQLPWTCNTEDRNLVSDLNTQVANTGITGRSGGDLKTMRLAQSCNGEYANFFGATSAAQVALVLAAYNATLTRCNGVYEKDLALHLNLIANTTAVIYYTPATDPYSTTLSQWNAQLQSTLTSVIGEANYDIGHMFGATGGGGNAGCIGCVCTDGSKGSGITSPADGIPQGDNFDIDYVVHEVGHQLGGNHTFSHSLEGSGVNKEVGSGITIMGYAGITSYDVAPHSIDIYHEATIAQIQANLATKTCPVTTNISANNATPVVAAVSNYTIPISTPFALTGSATDVNPGDVLTYCWEQNDNATTSGANSVASPTKATGPNWLSFSPTVSPTRLFPKLSTILAGLFVTPVITGGDAAANIEALSSVSRTLNFRLTVRDNAPYSSTAPVTVGQTQFTDMAVTVSNTSGPFIITQPNTNLSWPGSSSQTVTWNVANTTALPVSCTNVKISLSTDGGLTFPTVLIASTTNDGSETLSIPNLPTTTARIKVEAVGNIFFDISNTNFTITDAAPGFDFDNPAATSISCGGPTSAAITLGTVSYLGYTTPITLSASGLPSGTTVGFSVNPVTPGSNTIVTLNNTNTLANGDYNITITGVSGSITHTRIITYTIQAGAAPTITTQPLSQTLCSGSGVTFSVVASGTVTGYQWQLSTDGGTVYNNIGGATTSAYTVSGTTFSQNNYRYKVIVSSQCNSATSNTAILTVNPSPSTPVITASATSVCLGTIVTLNATAITSQTSTLGSGTSTSTGASTGSALGPNPLQNYYGGNKQQMIFRATELTALGFVSGSSITAIRLTLVAANSTVPLQNLVVKMKNTSSTTMASWETGLTLVRTAANYTPVIGENSISLTTAFVWDGTNNLIIEINYSNANGGVTNGNNNTAKYSATSFVSTRFYRVDNASAATVDAYVGTSASTTFNYSQRNDITFDYTNTANITWSPTTDLYTDAGATTGYTGTVLPTVYAKPLISGTANFIATASNSFGCTNTSPVTITVNPLPTVSFSGLAASYCTTDAAVTLTGLPSGGTFSGTGVSGNTFSPSTAGAGGPYTITYSYTDANGCSNSSNQQVSVTVCASTITLNMKLFLQGYYAGGGTMQPVLNNQAVPNSLVTQTDNITVELHHPTTYSLIDTKQAVLNTDGTVSVTFTQPAGSYYIAILHRNTVQTWTANPVACSVSTALYNFSTAANKAMGDNQFEVETGIWAFYTGDLNQDDFIDGNDFPIYDSESASGGLYDGTYTKTDINGDGFVDGNDFPVFDGNSSNGVSSVHL